MVEPCQILICPFQFSCPAGLVSEGPCPSYGGFTDIDGLPTVYCSATKSGLESSCPNCGTVADFSLGKGPLQNWLCKRCNYYRVSSTMAVKHCLPRSGLAVKVRCSCNEEAWVIKHPIPDISQMKWECPKCNQVSLLTDIMEGK